MSKTKEQLDAMREFDDKYDFESADAYFDWLAHFKVFGFKGLAKDLLPAIRHELEFNR